MDVKEMLPMEEECSSNKPPHFLIVGAPKAGTTSLYRYLLQHPQIYMPDNKEPRFFCGYSVNAFEFGINHFHPEIITSKADYLALFQEASSRSISGEASTDYLSCPQAASRIHAWNPAAKIIIMLRNPVDRAYSEYQHSISAKFQSNTFWESLCLEEERIKQNFDPIFWHVRRGLYFHGVKRYIDLFGKDGVRIVFFEEFADLTASVVDATFEFLGVPACPVDVTKRYNAGSEREPHVLHDIFSSQWLRPIVRSIGKGAGPYSKAKIMNLLPRKKGKGARDHLSNEQYEWLRGKFNVDILKLQTFLGRDLRYWL